MILFSDREKLSERFNEWATKNSVMNTPFAVITFLQGRGLLNEDKVRQYLNGLQTRDYTRIPGYEDMPNLTARYNYLHDLLERFQQVRAYRCTRPEALAHKCQECPLRAELERIGARATCCNWAAESKPDEAIKVLERLLKEEENEMSRSVNLYWEPERPTEPPKEKTYCCPVCGEENPAQYFRNNLMEIVGCNHCIEELDAAAWEADHAD